MAKYKIAVLPGDGIGIEVIRAALTVLEAANLDAEYIHGDIGWEFWCKEGNPLPDRTLKIIKETDCALFGAITSKPKEDAEKELAPELRGKGLTYYSPIVRLRQELDLYACVRPCKAFPGNPLNYRDGIDIVIFRENTEGLYAGVEFYPLSKKVFEALCENPKMKVFEKFGLENVAVSLRVMTRQACERIVRAAFEYAKKHGRKSVTLVDKPNVLRETGGLMLNVARKVASEYPEIEYREANIDAMCMWMLKNPLDHDVIVAENMFGDILSDLAAQLVGGLGFAYSGNIGDNYAVFEPVHGSAPKHAGKNKVNPIAAILAGKMMVEWLGEVEIARAIEASVAEVILEGKLRTYDMGGQTTTTEMAEGIAAKVAKKTKR
ncbi:MAG: isocitrate/isopropylmalate dehydrogenase family protein [Thaumarchaeota archaeon]|jgi:3-isopropylmalate dehydrogenase|nr:isocitrate/isopropylmalate dehydrogenase family protein [Candidatus Terraquivivens yellowstonensis]MCL7392441.1 isocitrate/isopropylmalate dehydrogenase family protein [Candidatus Terraquivivens yellowstonensis]MCL7398548.1 isocitrate/isopropylmalate dehydrogenase family protein [Candidatus Terraquivivens yellowstonensis]MCL7400677.1 isocitrate/isopropylmalate dehydrogenase family protein [Candidatus Terraquivivens yellowstonensis]